MHAVIYDPWRDLGERAHLTLVMADLPIGVGWYVADLDGIALDRRLDMAGRRSVLAHELAHVDLAHHDQQHGAGPDGPRQSRRCEHAADALAARRLIPIELLVYALRWSQDEHELAEELWVDTDTIRTRLAGLTLAEQAWIDAELWEG